MFLPQLPYPPHSGGRIVTAPLVEGLAERHEVHLFSLIHGLQGEEEGKQEIAKVVASVNTVPGTKRLDPGAALSALGSDILNAIYIKPISLKAFSKRLCHVCSFKHLL